MLSAAAGQSDRCEEAPSLVADWTALDAPIGQPGDLCRHVITHQIDLMLAVALGGRLDRPARQGRKLFLPGRARGR